jgi:hypothetical protein
MAIAVASEFLRVLSSAWITEEAAQDVHPPEPRTVLTSGLAFSRLNTLEPHGGGQRRDRCSSGSASHFVDSVDDINGASPEAVARSRRIVRRGNAGGVDGLLRKDHSGARLGVAGSNGGTRRTGTRSGARLDGKYRRFNSNQDDTLRTKRPRWQRNVEMPRGKARPCRGGNGCAACVHC